MVNFKYIMLTVVTSLTMIVSTVISTRSESKQLNRMNHVAYAMTEIVNNLSNKQLMKLDVVVYGHDRHLKFLAHKVIKSLANGTHSVNSEHKSHDEKISWRFGQTSKIILASQELEVDGSEPTKEEMAQYYPYHDAVMIFYYLNESNMTAYANTLNKLPEDIKLRALFIGHTTSRSYNSLKLFGYVKYLTCTDNFTLSLTNRFIASKMKWTHKTFRHEYKNFNGCPLIVYVPNAVDCTLDFKVSKNGIIRLSRPYGELIHEYAEKHNAIVQVKFRDRSTDKSRCDIFLYHTTFVNKFNDRDMVTPTVAIDEHQITLLVARGRRFTPFEKLILPFDSSIWYLNILTVLAGYLAILILYQMPLYMQKFVFGTHNRDPSMALAQIFFGIGLIQTPGRNFSRFVFMMFTILCLIIRTAYQSKMYDFLQYDERQPTMKTIQEVRQNNVSISPFHQVYLSGELVKELNMAAITEEDYGILFEGKEGEHAFTVNRVFMKCSEMEDPKLYRDMSKNLRMADDDLVTGVNTWYLNKNSVVHKSVNKFLLECHQSGIIVHFKNMRNYIFIEPEEITPEKEKAKVLSMYMLSAGFYVWLASIGIACVVFVLEHIYKRVSQFCV